MSDLKPDTRLQQLRRRHQESGTMLGIAMAGLAAVFIVAIVTAYTYVANPQTAYNPPATASSTTGSGDSR